VSCNAEQSGGEYKLGGVRDKYGTVRYGGIDAKRYQRIARLHQIAPRSKAGGEALEFECTILGGPKYHYLGIASGRHVEIPL
jgi:hypothetical protein